MEINIDPIAWNELCMKLLEEEEKKIAWAAGIVDGEGCFKKYRNTYTSKKRAASGDYLYNCCLYIGMTDQDTILKLKKVLNCGVLGGPVQRKEHFKPLYELYIAKQKDLFSTLIKIMPHLSKRRLEKAKEIFEYLEPKICG